MSRKSSPRVNLPVEEIIKRYLDGETMGSLARDLSVDNSTIKNRLANSGISIREHKKKRTNRYELPITEVVTRYQNGESVKALAESFDVQRATITRHLKRAGISIRGRSESMYLRMAQTSPEDRLKLSAAAHDAVRGKPISIEAKIKRAKTIEFKQSHVSSHERKIGALLQERGIDFTIQKALGIYNIDLAITPVALEIWGGHWHWSGHHLERTEQRFRFIMEQGWHILCLAITPTKPLDATVIDYIIAYLEDARKNPNTLREYRIIRGAGELVAKGNILDKQINVEPTFTAERDPITSQFKTVYKKPKI